MSLKSSNTFCSNSIACCNIFCASGGMDVCLRSPRTVDSSMTDFRDCLDATLLQVCHFAVYPLSESGECIELMQPR
ncbi:hypothetical protein AG1IA_02903 [Rhizoctonia solani AG-1 IA]|uniref:Uncharacterized protein n=1 Tax=Thanatephorus cucumeris (strain AG1-IA) TaxID=983506 RepID=L8X215_THACA|nr:hypothetical protein AG1IA_02903 [Rhizoctonia solani AG-1 IA]